MILINKKMYYNIYSQNKAKCGVNKRQADGSRKNGRFKRQLRFESDYPVYDTSSSSTEIPLILRVSLKTSI